MNCDGKTHYAGCKCHEAGWKDKWDCAVEMAAQSGAEVARLDGLLCRIQLPVPLLIATGLTKLFPGGNVRMRNVCNHLEIYRED